MATLRAFPSSEPISGASAERVDMKFEVVVIPVADVDRSKEFHSKLGWRLDADFPFDNGFRVVQFTPPGSGCSVQFGTKMTSAAPGSAEGLYLNILYRRLFCSRLQRRVVGSIAVHCCIRCRSLPGTGRSCERRDTPRGWCRSGSSLVAARQFNVGPAACLPVICEVVQAGTRPKTNGGSNSERGRHDIEMCESAMQCLAPALE